ncbi:protein of unknown function UPF0075, partial [Tepidicaulis marinus]
REMSNIIVKQVLLAFALCACWVLPAAAPAPAYAESYDTLIEQAQKASLEQRYDEVKRLLGTAMELTEGPVNIDLGGRLLVELASLPSDEGEAFQSKEKIEQVRAWLHDGWSVSSDPEVTGQRYFLVDLFNRRSEWGIVTIFLHEYFDLKSKNRPYRPEQEGTGRIEIMHAMVLRQTGTGAPIFSVVLTNNPREDKALQELSKSDTLKKAYWVEGYDGTNHYTIAKLPHRPSPREMGAMVSRVIELGGVAKVAKSSSASKCCLLP